MNGVLEAGMYRLKPYYDTDAPISLPDCMYTLRSVYANSSVPSFEEATLVCRQQSVTVSVEDLERRQRCILKRLAELQRQVKVLADEQRAAAAAVNRSVSSCSKSAQKTAVITSMPTINDLVITAHPSSPPLSVFVLGQLLSSQCRVLTTSFIHSSAKNSVSQKLTRLFETDHGIITNRNAFQIGITIIWKDEKSGPSLMVEPNRQSAVCGEANIARYLARLLSPCYDDVNAADIVTATQIDVLLDVAASLLRCQSSQSTSMIKSLGAKLGRAPWFIGVDRPSLADIVLWSAVKQRSVGTQLTDNVRQWINRCDNLPEFAPVAQLLA